MSASKPHEATGAKPVEVGAERPGDTEWIRDARYIFLQSAPWTPTQECLNAACDAYDGLLEQLEAAQEALADINSIDRGWHPPLSDEEKLGKVRLIARRALRNVSSPAGDPK